jgi:hypothetical protein
MLTSVQPEGSVQFSVDAEEPARGQPERDHLHSRTSPQRVRSPSLAAA